MYKKETNREQKGHSEHHFTFSTVTLLLEQPSCAHLQAQVESSMLITHTQAAARMLSSLGSVANRWPMASRFSFRTPNCPEVPGVVTMTSQ